MRTRCIIAICILISIVPLAQMVFHLVPEVVLTGAVMVVPRPVFTVQGLVTGTYQQSVERWLDAHIGWRGAMIRTNNQLNFSVFREITAGNNERIVLGKNNFLFEKNYIDTYLGRFATSTARLNLQLEQIKKLQDGLRERGIGFVLIISPSKASVYPEYLPDAYRALKTTAPSTMYERLRPLLATSGVSFIDGHALTQGFKSSRSYPLFPRGGTHWSYYTACLVDQVLIATLEQQLQKTLRQLSCDPPTVDLKPDGTDRDLANLINLWDDHATDGLTPHPSFAPTVISTEAYYPHLAYVGDSFVWTLTEVLHAGRVAPEQEIYYYYKSVSSYPENIRADLVTSTMDWQHHVFAKDAIILEVNETGLGKIGFGFVEDALAALEATKP